MASNPRTPPLGRSVQQTALPGGAYASQGMIAPSNPMVNDDGTPTDVTFRFCHSLLSMISDLQNAVTALQQRLTNAGL